MADRQTGRHARATPGVHRNESVVFIELTQGRHAIVDADAWSRIERDYGSRWLCSGDGKGYFYARKKQSDGAGGKRLVTLARAVMGAEPGDRVEVENGDSLDCRRSNLRCLETEAATKRKREYAQKREAYLARRRGRLSDETVGEEFL